MILRTPPPRKRRVESALQEDEIQGSRSPKDISNRKLVIFEDSPLASFPESSHEHPVTSDQMLCTYQCRQMVHICFDSFSCAISREREIFFFAFIWDIVGKGILGYVVLEVLVIHL